MARAVALALCVAIGGLGTAAAAPASPVVSEPQPAPEAVKPELSVGMLVGEGLVGGLVGGAGLLGGWYAGRMLDVGIDDCACTWVGWVASSVGVGTSLGYALTAPAGVYLAGRAGGQTGSLGWTYGGSLLGTGVGLLLLLTRTEASAVFALAAPVAGSMIGFNATRRYTDPARSRGRWTPTAHVTSERSMVGIAAVF